jgi:hypothetical protein
MAIEHDRFGVGIKINVLIWTYQNTASIAHDNFDSSLPASRLELFIIGRSAPCVGIIAIEMDEYHPAAVFVIESVDENHFALRRLPVRSHVFQDQPAAGESPAYSGSGLVNRTAAARSGVLAPLMCRFRERDVLDRHHLATHRAIAALPPSRGGGLVYDPLFLECLKAGCMVSFGRHGLITSFHHAPRLLSSVSPTIDRGITATPRAFAALGQGQEPASTGREAGG